MCLAPRITLKSVFNVPTCPCDQVIRVRSALIGFSPEWNHSDSRPRCPLNGAKCKRPTYHSDIMSCNGQRSCSFSQLVLNYEPHDKLCHEHQNGNFINVVYDCVNPGKTIAFCLSTLSFLVTEANNIIDADAIFAPFLFINVKNLAV